MKHFLASLCLLQNPMACIFSSVLPWTLSRYNWYLILCFLVARRCTASLWLISMYSPTPNSVASYGRVELMDANMLYSRHTKKVDRRHVWKMSEKNVWKDSTSQGVKGILAGCARVCVCGTSRHHSCIYTRTLLLFLHLQFSIHCCRKKHKFS